jgi:hypothetical protein
MQPWRGRESPHWSIFKKMLLTNNLRVFYRK